jgi:hypothetical protein
VSFLSISKYYDENHYKISNSEEISDFYSTDGKLIVTKNSPSYNYHRLKQFSHGAVDHLYVNARLMPSAIVYCFSEAHVVSMIDFARAHNYKVVVRSGGHSYTGESSSGFPHTIQLDLSNMDAMNVKENIIQVEPGKRLRKINNQLILHGLSFPRGECKNVAIGGHLQTSAFSFMSNSFGLGLDHVTEIRMVLSNGSIINATSNENSEVYKAVLGSAPGSYGIVTKYSLKAISDVDYPHTKFIYRKFNYSKDTYLKILQHVTFISKDQESKNLRDIFIQILGGHAVNIFDVVPDLPIIGTTSDWINVEKDMKNYVQIIIFWTGIDSGEFDSKWSKLYIDPIDQIEELKFPNKISLSLPLSILSSMNFSFKFDDYRYHSGLTMSNYYWSDKFMKTFVEEFDHLSKIPGLIINQSYIPIPDSSQFRKNYQMNYLTWRDVKTYLGQIIFFKDEAQSDMIAERMRKFQEENKKDCVYSDGQIRYNWLTVQTIFDNATNLEDPEIAKRYFPDQTLYANLRKLKTKIDPINMFHNAGTIPPLNETISMKPNQ